MEELLNDMRSLFNGLEAENALPLDQVPNLSINTGELPMLQGWKMENVRQTPTPTKSDQPKTSERAKEVVQVPSEPERKSKGQSKWKLEILLRSDP